jgi:hypothetical protein
MRGTGVFAVLAAALAAGCGTSSGGGPAVDASTDGAPSPGADGASASDGDVTSDADVTLDAAADGAARATDAAAPRDGAALDAASDAPTSPTGDGRECTHAADCHLFSACDSCTCLSETGSGPVCTGLPVECLIAPCGSKTAACDLGHCVVEP